MRRYIWTFVGLMVLTGATFGISFTHLGEWNTVIAMIIALAKSLLVALFFMHLVDHRVSSRTAIAVAVALAACLVGISYLDVESRTPASGDGTPSAALADPPAPRLQGAPAVATRSPVLEPRPGERASR